MWQDVFEYRVCSVEYSNVCDVARVYITVTNCYTIPGENTISGKVFVEQLPDDGAYDVSEGFAGGVQVDLYNDVNCDGDHPGLGTIGGIHYFRPFGQLQVQYHQWLFSCR